MASLFHLPLHKAASKLGISPTTLKRACRKVGIFKWPFRLLENEKMEEAAAHKLRLLNTRPDIPATDPTLNCSRNSTPYSSPAADVSTDMCIPDHRQYRIPNQADITEAVRLLTIEKVENRRHLLREQEENRCLLRMLAWPATVPVGIRHNEHSGGSIFESGSLNTHTKGPFL